MIKIRKKELLQIRDAMISAQHEMETTSGMYGTDRPDFFVAGHELTQDEADVLYEIDMKASIEKMSNALHLLNFAITAHENSQAVAGNKSGTFTQENLLK